MVHSPNPIPPPPPGRPWANPPKKKNRGCRYTQVCIHTHSFLIQTPNQSLKRWENATSGHKAKATNFQITEFLCFEFLRLVELLRDMFCCVNLRHLLGIYATFLGNLRRFGETFTPIYTTWGPGAKKPVNPRKLPACQTVALVDTVSHNSMWLLKCLRAYAVS